LSASPRKDCLPNNVSMASLKDFIVSRVRVKLLQTIFEDPKEMYHIREFVRRTGEEINGVRRELSRLEEAGIVGKELRGNRVYYWGKSEYPYFAEVLRLVAKTSGLGEEIRKNRGKLGKINFVMFSGGFVKRMERKSDHVDVLVVGDVVLPELAQLIRAEEQKRGVEINYTPMTKDEFEFRKSRRDPFILDILTKSRVMIIGDEDDFVS